MTDLDRYLDDFGGRLAGAADRRRPRPRRLAFAAVAAVATAAAFAGVLGATRQPLDPVAEARQALAPRGDIVYMKVTTLPRDPDGDEGAPNTVELWSATDPPRWRLVQDLPPQAGVVSDAQGPIHGRQEFTYADGEQRNYVAERDTLEIVEGFDGDHDAARVPTPFNLGSGDVGADLRTMLRDGQVSDRGEQEVGGRTVRRLVSEVTEAEGTFSRKLVYDVDPDSFEPIQGILTIVLPGGRDATITTRIRVDAYERIPIDETSLKLLEIQTTPRTKVTVRHATDVATPTPP